MSGKGEQGRQDGHGSQLVGQGSEDSQGGTDDRVRVVVRLGRVASVARLAVLATKAKVARMAKVVRVVGVT